MASESDSVTAAQIGDERRAAAHEAGVRTEDSAANALGDQPKAPLELHVCMGLNACAGHGAGGSGKMAGMGSCATVIHVCHGDNHCRGQGGCGYAGSAYEQAKPGDQACFQNGSCASPINGCRVFSAGPYKGKSVWKSARAIFEERMYEAQVQFGPSPGEGYPDDLIPPGYVQ
jgi:hypothetical protein